MQLKRNKSKVTLVGVMLVCAFFIPIFASAKVITPSSKSKSLETDISGKAAQQSNIDTKSANTLPLLSKEEVKKSAVDKSITPEILRQMQELAKEPASNSSNRNLSWKESLVGKWSGKLFSGIKSFVSHPVNSIKNVAQGVKNSFSSIYHGVGNGIGGVYSSIKKVTFATATVVKAGVKGLVNIVGKKASGIVSDLNNNPGFGLAFGLSLFGTGYLLYKATTKWRLNIAKGLTSPENNGGEFIDSLIPNSWKQSKGVGKYVLGFATGSAIVLMSIGPGIAAAVLAPEQVVQSVVTLGKGDFEYVAETVKHPSYLLTDAQTVKTGVTDYFHQDSYALAQSVGKGTTNLGLLVAGTSFTKAGSVVAGEEAIVGAERATQLAKISTSDLSVDEVLTQLKTVNPTQGKFNCSRCVVATDAMLDGRPASALNSNYGTAEELVTHYGKDFTPGMTYNSIEELLLEAGNGSKGIVWGEPISGAGHVFNAVNIDGKVYFLDGQTGKLANLKSYYRINFMQTN